MRWNLMLGTMIAVGALATTEVRAQENAAGNGSTAAAAQQKDAAGNAASDTSGDNYGAYVDGPATVDADGVPVAKPNPMSRFEKRSQPFDNMPIGMPLVDDPRADGPAPDGQTK
jgi:hypothetical protein